MTTNLQRAIKNVYKTFASYPLRSQIDGCPCCVSDSDQETIHQKPLRQLTHDDLARYTFKAMTTWGDTSDFKHFLPRMLELMAQTDFAADTALVLRKLQYANWHQWPADELNGITNFLMSWWSEQILLKSWSDTSLFVDLYKTMGQMELLLNNWPVTIADYSFQNLIRFIASEAAILIHRKGHYKNIDQATIHILETWLITHMDIVERGFYQYEQEDPVWAEQIAAAYDQLAMIKSSL